MRSNPGWGTKIPQTSQCSQRGEEKEWIRAKEVNNLRKKTLGGEWPALRKMQDLSSLTRTELRLRALISGLQGNSTKVNHLNQFKSVVMDVVFQSLIHVRLFVTPWTMHARLPCPSLSLEVYSNSHPLSQWCYLTNSSSAAPFLCLQSFPASGSLAMSQLLASGGPSIGASASVFPMNIQGLFPLGLTGLISVMFNGLSRVFSSS